MNMCLIAGECAGRRFFATVAAIAVFIMGFSSCAAPKCGQLCDESFVASAAASEIQALINAGANVHARLEGDLAPLHYAAHASKNPGVVRVLLAAGADVNVRTKRGITPLHYAAGSGNLEAVRALIKAGADIHSSSKGGHSPLFSAVYRGNIEAVRALIEAGANVNASSGSGYPLLFSAVNRENIDIVRALVEAGADVNARADLHIKFDAENWAILGSVGTGANIGELIGTKTTTGIYEDGITPMHLAAGKGNLEIMRALVEMGADINARLNENYDLTPLHVAAQFGDNPEAIILLLELGADHKVRTIRGELAVDLAKKNSHIKDSEAYRKLSDASY